MALLGSVRRVTERRPLAMPLTRTGEDPATVPPPGPVPGSPGPRGSTSEGADPQGPQRFGLRIVFFVALAVFSLEVTWNFYDAQVPPLIEEYVSSAALVGLFMGLDNVVGIFIQPWIGNRSDNTRSRWGRRVPYLVVAMPFAALFFLAIPHAASLPVLVALMLGYAVIANSIKPVAESLMPDFVAPEHRSRANAIVKVGTGLTIIVSALISLTLVDDHPKIAFAIPALIMVLSAVVVSRKVRDRESPGYQAAVAKTLAAPDRAERRVRDIVRDIVTDANRTRLLLLSMVVVFTGGWGASRALLTPYATAVLDLTRGEAGGLVLPAGLVFLAAAIPAALLAERIGRVRTIAVGITTFAAALVLGTIVPSATGATIALCLAAAGYAAFAINTVVIVWNLAPPGAVGAYTGLYTISSAGGAALGPPVVGLLVDLTGWRWFFLDAAILAVVALVLLWRADEHLRRHHGAIPA
jgi:MFS family permease